MKITFFAAWLARSRRSVSQRKRAAKLCRATRKLCLEELEIRLAPSVTDFFSSALLIASNASLSGILGASPSFYALRVTDSGRLEAEVAPTAGETRLSLLSSDGSVLMQSDGQSPSNHNDLIDVNLPSSTAGITYYLEVEGLGNGSGGYVLTTSYLNTNTLGESLPVAIAPSNIATENFNRIGNADLTGAPLAVASADFNSDGFPDLVTADPTTGVVAVSLGNSDGTFQASWSVSLGGEPDAVTVGDFNHDGRPDIAVANALTNNISILPGIGDGAFAAPLSLSVGSHPDALVAGDFNGDGNLDLAVANFGSDTVSILLGNADGSFAALQAIAVGKGPVALAVGDLNGDHTTELVVANRLSQDLSILEADGNGTFRSVATVALGFVPGSVVSGDFNGDGKLDLAVTDQAGNAVALLLGNGNDTFQAPLRVATGTGPVALVTDDFNGDGHLDLAIANNTSNDVTILLGRGDGAFHAQAPFSVGPSPFGLVASDFNKDGRLDLATANGLGETVSVGLGLGDGTFTSPGAVFPSLQARPIVADFNGDGIPDVVVLRGDGKILFRAGLVGGGFDAPLVINPDPVWAARDLTIGSSPGMNYLVASNARTGSLAFYAYFGGQFRQIITKTVPGVLPAHFLYGDINGDGLQDGVMYLGDTGQIIVYLQHPYDDLSNRPPDYQLQVGRGASSMILADVNGDGRPDILVTDQISGEVHVFLNSSTAPFSSELSFRSGYGPSSVVLVAGAPQIESLEKPVAMVVGLFNGGAIPDLAVLNQGANQVDILQADGQGGFYNPSPAASLVTGLDPIAMVTADFNGDGIPDLAVLNKGSNDISIFLGNGHGGFIEQTTTSADGQEIRLGAGNSPTGLTAADINMDGKVDLLVGNAQGDVLTILGYGDGTFRPYQRIDRHVGLALTDLNDAVAPGIALANQSLDRVVFQTDLATSTFQQGRQDGVLAPSAVKFADLNGDGIPDLIVANGGGNDVLVYLGQDENHFGPAHHFFVGTNPVGITVSDLNGDGISDLVIANQGSNDVSILFGQGDGAGWTMTAGPRLDAGGGPVATVVQDVNRDGIPDILVANSASNNVSVLLGVGRGFFNDKNPLTYPTGSDPVQLFVGHFDDRPGLDLVTVNAGSNDLTFFSAFGPGREIPLGDHSPVAALAGDFNHDGASDLLVASRDGSFALLLGGQDGPAVACMTATNLVNVSDLALASVNSEMIDVYATTDGNEQAIPLTFLLDTDSALALSATSGEPAFAPAANAVEAEFSSPTGSALEIITTLVLGSLIDAPAASVAPAQENQEAFTMFPFEENGGPWETSEANMSSFSSDGMDADDIARNALITGTIGVPVQQYLRQRFAVDIPSVEGLFPKRGHQNIRG